MAKLNSLVDADIIQALYSVSQQGVKVNSTCAASAACDPAFPG